MKRKIVAVLLLLLASGFQAEAQQRRKVPRVVLLPSSGADNNPNIEAFLWGLRELGYVKEQDIIVEHRSAEYIRDRFSDLVADLVRLKVDVIVASANANVRLVMKATKTTPIVMVFVESAVENGFVASLPQPGGNITGLSVPTQLNGKRLELLKEAIPRISRVAVLWNPATRGYLLRENQEIAQTLGIQLRPVEVRGPEELERSFAAISKDRPDAIIVLRDLLTRRFAEPIAQFMAKKRIPSMYTERQFVKVGGLISYGPHFAELWRRAAYFVDKILKGAKPADLPIEQPTKFELVINLKTAKNLGLTIPSEVLMFADEVIK